MCLRYSDENILDYGEEEGTKLTRGKKRSLIKPLNDMNDGDTADVLSNGVTYKLKRTGDHYYCTYVLLNLVLFLSSLFNL